MLLGHFAKPQELAFLSIEHAALVAIGGYARVHTIARDAIIGLDCGQRPAQMREIVRIANAVVVELDHSAQRSLYRLEQVGLASTIASYDETTVVAAHKMV